MGKRKIPRTPPERWAELAERGREGRDYVERRMRETAELRATQKRAQARRERWRRRLLPFFPPARDC